MQILDIFRQMEKLFQKLNIYIKKRILLDTHIIVFSPKCIKITYYFLYRK